MAHISDCQPVHAVLLTRYMCKNVSDSFSLLQLTGGLSKGLALLTMDQEYVNRFSVRSVTLQQRLLQGVQALGVGAYEGLLGKTQLLSSCSSSFYERSEIK